MKLSARTDSDRIRIAKNVQQLVALQCNRYLKHVVKALEAQMHHRSGMDFLKKEDPAHRESST